MEDKKLIIVESPTKAKTITKFLGTDCKIVASNGHIRTLPKDSLSVDIRNGYKPKYEDDKAKTKVISLLKSELKNADELILATDEDREGESISWHLLEVLKPKVPYRRMVFHEITKKAILEAFENGRDLDMNLVHAQEARRILDRLYGYTISPVLWSKLSNKSLSAGRVQSPGLRLIVDREKLRLAYKKSEYWDIDVQFDKNFKCKLESFNGKKIATGKDFDSDTGKFSDSPKVMLLNFEKSKVVLDKLKGCSFIVKEVREKSVTQKPAPPFTTSTLQQEGNRKLHLAAKDTMKIAQSLYENGFITYMRTDSTALSQEGIKAARDAVVSICGSDFLNVSERHYQTKTANAQEAHEAIRPAGDSFKNPEDSGLSGKELALYRMIFNRTLACQMKDAQKVTTTVVVEARDSENTGLLSVSGTRIEFPGYIRIYVEGTDNPEAALEEKDTILPKIEEGETLKLVGIDSSSHETKMPSRYTEAALVQELEKKGIGRPSTYATIIDRIIEKGYVKRESGSLVPTFTGFGVSDLLSGYFENRIDYEFTSQMEEDLDKIANGSLNEIDYLKKFYEGKNGLLEQVKTVKSTIDSKKVKSLNLPQLKAENYINLGPFGPYVQNSDGKFISIPSDWTPASVTDDMIDGLKKGNSVVGDGSTPPAVLGKTDDGKPLMYCTGRYGDYWQIGNRAETSEVKRLKVPSDLKGKSLSVDFILQLFELPKKIGTDENGNDITIDIGKYGPYIKCNDEYRNVKGCEELMLTTEAEARKILQTPKISKTSGKTETAKKTFVKKSYAKKTVSDSEELENPSSIIKNFGEYKGKNLAIRIGKFGFYLKHGDNNYRIPQKYQHDEDACKAMSPAEVLEYLK